MSIQVLTPGLQTSVQDLGRPGYRHLGISQSGAADAHALRLANLLVGNSPSEAGLEMTLCGPHLRFESAALIALCGADMVATNDGQSVPMRRPVWIPAHSELLLDACHGGARTYLAVAGGINSALVLGSRSTDLSSGIGGIDGRALRSGDQLPCTNQLTDSQIVRSSAASFSIRRDRLPAQNSPAILRVLIGTHTAALDPKSATALFENTWQVGPAASRMGLRLQGPALQIATLEELLSEPTVPGTVQLPPDGLPILLGVEGPTTGGYPRVAQIIHVDLPLLGQLRAGDTLRFSLVSLEEAGELRRQRERQLDQLELGISLYLPECLKRSLP